MSQLYKGDLLPSAAWQLLSENYSAVLVDVRTSAEWHYVGEPDLRSLKKHLIKLEWRSLPGMEKNTHFGSELSNIIHNQDASIIFLCRTGGRSAEAAIELTSMGYKNCYNVVHGFEGDINQNGHRGLINGWKADKLPWRQD